MQVKIEFEISEIDKLLSKADVLISKCKNVAPDFIELCAAASILHSYYNGIESIFVLIAKNIDKKVFDTNAWHKNLLQSMFESNEKRYAVLHIELKEKLINYLGFRHFFRHSYGHEIEWEKARNLFLGLHDNWKEVKTDIIKFLLK